MSNDSINKNSFRFTSGLIFGAAVAAGATFLYKTKQGKQVKKQLEDHFDDAKSFFSTYVNEVKSQLKTLEGQSELKPQLTRHKKKKSKPKSRKKVFIKSGKPLNK